MWHSKRLLLLLTIVLLVINCGECKKKKSKRPKKQDEEDLVTYPSFGYDNGPSQEFKPSALDMAGNFNSMLNGQETTTMGLYGPAFPTAEDTTPFNIFATNGQVSQSFSPYMNNMGSSNQDSNNFQSMLNDYRSKLPGYEDLNSQHKDQSPKQEYESYDQHAGDSAPVYGTKLTAKDTPKKPSLYGDSLNYQSMYSYASTWPTTNEDNLEDLKPSSSSSFKNPFKTGPPITDFSNFRDDFHNDNGNTHSYASMSTSSKESYPLKETFPNNKYSYNHNSMNGDQKDVVDYTDKDSYKPTVHILPNSYKNLNYSDSKYNFKNTELYSSYKDKFKLKPTESTKNEFNSLDFNDWKGSVKSNNYATIKDSFKYGDHNAGMNSQFSFPDYASSQSNINNVIDFTGDNNPFKDSVHDSDFSSVKDSSFKQAIDFMNIMSPYTSSVDHSTTNTWKPPKTNFPSDEALTKHFGFDFKNPTKSTFDIPAMTTQWGNAFKTYGTTNHYKSKKPYGSSSQTDGELSESVVHIPKRTQSNKLSFGKLPTGKTIEEWNRDVSNRFKSEEELLGLRNHDTSHPNYLPTYKLNEELDDMKNYASNFDYGSAIDNWRYLHSKYKNNQFDQRPSGSKQHGQSIHVPYPKPYPIEVPHPVIVPVPQPYPVRVPVPRPVAVPVVRELRIPVERPVPYPVIKKVPYPVERPVPVPIEKPVAVPVMRPYPVPIPHVRPVFHHARPRPPRDDAELGGDAEEEASPQRTPPRPPRNSRARIRPRRPSAQSRVYRRGPRRPSSRRKVPPSRRVLRPRHFQSTPKSDDRLSNPVGQAGPRERPTNAEQLGERYAKYVKNGEIFSSHEGIFPDGSSRSGARYAPGFEESEESDGHDHDDYFKYCQSNPLCYIQSLKMPIME